MNEILDITKVTPEATDHYFFDTNVWFWVTYCSTNDERDLNIVNGPKKYQIEKYPDFVEKVLDIGAKIFHCPLTYTELANLIEKAEYAKYINTHSLGKSFTRKNFRENQDSRKLVMDQIKTAWETINQFSTCLGLELIEQTTQAIHSKMERSSLDSYDAIFIHLMQSHKIQLLVSDDRDMMTSDISQILTANNNFL
ncbi:PIN domain-containing protein [Acinetobacter rudis]|uniref:PIN domain-containing protein n=1 Tax=Acinetobacter rudis TaxID=632955 RepID=UPI00333FCEE5